MRKLRELKRSIRNLFQFFKVVWNFRWWDYSYSMDIFIKAIELQARYTKKYGLTYKREGDPVISKMERVVKLWNDNIGAGRDIEIAEERCGVDTLDENITDNQRKAVYTLANKIEQEQWEEFWNIIQDKEYGLKTWWD